MAARCCQPARNTTMPQTKSSSEMRERKNPELIVPSTSAISANTTMTKPHHDGLILRVASFARSCQSKNNENTGTKKP